MIGCGPVLCASGAIAGPCRAISSPFCSGGREDGVEGGNDPLAALQLQRGPQLGNCRCVVRRQS